MTPDRFLQIKKIFQAVMELAPDQREAFLTDSCGADTELRREVESLISAEADAGDFIARPVLDASALAETQPGDDQVIGKQVGVYRIEKPIGQGGMGTVYLASRADRRTGKPVAIKMISRGMDTDSVLRRFRAERQILAHLEHPNIARILDGGATSEGLPYLVMEFVEGEPIDKYCDRKTLSTAERLRLFLETCAAVSYAHKRRVVHRDIKPGNILITTEGVPKLLDFGIAKVFNPEFQGSLTAVSGGRMMTPAYASPEQIRGESVTALSDVYSLGVLLYELLTARGPYRSDPQTNAKMARAICDEEPEPPSRVAGLPEALDEIVLTALRKQPDMRYGSAAEFSAEIAKYLEGRALSGKASNITSWQQFEPARGLPTLIGSIPASVERQRGTTSRRPVIAVLQFKNLSNQPETTWLATALQEMFISELTAGEQLRVVSNSNDDADFLISGSYLLLKREGVNQVRLDVRIHQATDQQSVTTITENGTDNDWIDIVSRAGQELRQRIGVAGASPLAQDANPRGGFPQHPEAGQLYAEGLEKMRLLDPVTAQRLLESASSLDPDSPLIRAALAEVCMDLGYETRAAQEARQAYDLSGHLGREQRLSIEGRYWEATKQWEKAIDIYRRLWGYFADNLNYGLRLAAAQRSASRGKEALATIESLRAIAGADEDPRVDLAEGDAAESISDYRRQEEACRRAVGKARARGSKLSICRALLAHSRALYFSSQPQAALKVLEETKQLSIETSDKAALAKALGSMALINDDAGETVEALRLYREAMELWSQIGDLRGMSSTLNNLAILLKDQGKLEESLKMHEEALALRREIDDKSWIAVSLNNIGVIYFELDRLSDAAKHYEESLVICRSVGDRRNVVRALHNLALVLKFKGRLAESRKSLEESLDLRAQLEDRRGTAVGLVALAQLLHEIGDFEGAKRAAERVMTLAEEVQLTQATCQALCALGDIALTEGDMVTARKHHEEALAIRTRINEERTVPESRIALSRVALAEGRPEEAAELARAVLEDPNVEFGAPVEAEARLHLAHALLDCNRNEEAEEAVGRARLLTSETERLALKAIVTIASARVQAVMGSSEAAVESINAVLHEVKAAGSKLLELEAERALKAIGQHA